MSTKAYLFHLLDDGSVHTWNQDFTMGVETPENPRVVFEWETINPKNIAELCSKAFRDAHLWIQANNSVNQYRQLVILTLDDQLLGASRLPELEYKPFPGEPYRHDDRVVRVTRQGLSIYLLQGDVFGRLEDGQVLRMASPDDDPEGQAQIYARAIDVAIKAFEGADGALIELIHFSDETVYWSGTV